MWRKALDRPHLEADLCRPSRRLIVGIDSLRTHGDRRAFEADRRKDAALAAVGYRVVRFTDRTSDATIGHRLRALMG